MGYWENRRPVQRTRAVHVRDLARVAVDLLDEGGLPALTVRAVALRLQVAPASLYSRVASVDDLLDLALDDVLGRDPELQRELRMAELHPLMLAYHRHLVAHPWACRVIAMRAPRGPNYLRLSERMCTLLVEGGSTDPLGDAYALSNFVIGSATTTAVAKHERAVPVDGEVAPLYAALHEAHEVDADRIVSAGLDALLRGDLTVDGASPHDGQVGGGPSR